MNSDLHCPANSSMSGHTHMAERGLNSTLHNSNTWVQSLLIGSQPNSHSCSSRKGGHTGCAPARQGVNSKKTNDQRFSALTESHPNISSSGPGDHKVKVVFLGLGAKGRQGWLHSRLPGSTGPLALLGEPHGFPQLLVLLQQPHCLAPV